MPSRNEISAGGVVYRRTADGIYILICKDAGYHRWVLPKGLVNKGESHEQTALREIQEETGVTAKLIAPLGEPEKYIYTAQGVRVFKSVYYFLLEYQSGSETNHDHEMEAIVWKPIDEAIDMLAYKAAKNVVLRAKTLLENTA
jgi:8-oxo-dGTP pyrophosphatase MutT (NUDIX family)